MTITRSPRKIASRDIVRDENDVRPDSATGASALLASLRAFARRAHRTVHPSAAPRLHGERARQRRALTHAAGKLGRKSVAEPDESNFGQQFVGPRERRRAASAPAHLQSARRRFRARCATERAWLPETPCRDRDPDPRSACRRSRRRRRRNSNPPSRCNSVVLPQPLGPRIVTNSPSSIGQVDRRERFDAVLAATKRLACTAQLEHSFALFGQRVAGHDQLARRLQHRRRQELRFDHVLHRQREVPRSIMPRRAHGRHRPRRLRGAGVSYLAAINFVYDPASIRDPGCASRAGSRHARRSTLAGALG